MGRIVEPFLINPPKRLRRNPFAGGLMTVNPPRSIRALDRRIQKAVRKIERGMKDLYNALTDGGLSAKEAQSKVRQVSEQAWYRSV